MKARSIVYWVMTVLIALPIGAGGVMQVMRPAQQVEGFRALGYPVYFMVVLGIWKALGGLAIVWPGFPRLKEWAYAGIVFDLTGAAVSNYELGGKDVALHVIAPLAMTVMAMVSWALRPASRRIGVILPSDAGAV